MSFLRSNEAIPRLCQKSCGTYSDLVCDVSMVCIKLTDSHACTLFLSVLIGQEGSLTKYMKDIQDPCLQCPHGTCVSE